MSERKASVRVLSFLLVLCMVVGLMPMNVFAADATVLDAAIFCSDLHGDSTNLVSILGQVKNSGVTYSSVGLVGDTCMTVSDVTSDISGALEYEPKVMFSYAKSHDTENGSDISTKWNYSGEVENVSDYYLVYTIRETDMQNASDANTAAPAFTTWYNGLTAAQKALPIFIMSHRPLHDRRDDNAGAATWYSAISAAAESSDIVFFWGHNHTGDNSVDQAAYYVAKDGNETMTIYNYNGPAVTPNFTYMNAGYIHANGQDPARKPVATTVQITADNLIFQDYTTSGMYTNSNYSHNVTVEREFAVQEPTLTGLTVSGQESYYAGDAFVAPTVTAVYSDTSKNTVLTAKEYEVSGTYDMNTAGTYTLTYTYEDSSAQYTFKVENVYISSIAVTTQPTKLVYLTGEELDTTGMVVTATYNNGTTAELAARTEETAGYYLSTVDMTTAGEKTVTVNYWDGNTTLTTTFTINVEEGVAEGVTLTGIEITKNPDKTEYLIHESLNLDGMIVVATFSNGSTVELDYKPFSDSTVYGGYDLYNFSMHVEKAHELAVVYTFGDVTCYDTTTINVWDDDFTDENTDVKVHVADGDYGVTAVNVAPSANSYVASALRDYMKQGAMMAYDITLTLDSDQTEDGEAVYTLTEGEKTVTLPIPEGVTNPVVYYVSDDGATVTNMNAVKNDDGTVTFKTTHFSTYVIGEDAVVGEDVDATVPGSQTTSTKDVWVKVDAPVDGGEYLIVTTGTAGTSGYVMGNSTAITPVSGTLNIDGADGTYTYIETTGTVWTASGSDSSFSFKNTDGTYLGYTQTDEGDSLGQYFGGGYSYSLNTADAERTWTVSNNQVKINLQSTYAGRFAGDDTYADYYLTGGSSWSMSEDSANVYFYEKKSATVSTGTPDVTYGMDITYPGGTDGAYVNTNQAITVKGVTSESTLQLGAEFTSSPSGYSVPEGGEWYITSSNTAVATVGEKTGLVTFTGVEGQTLIQANYTWTAADGNSYTVKNYVVITTKAPVYDLGAISGENQVKIGGTVTLTATPTKDDEAYTTGNAVTWSSDNSEIASVDASTGVVTGKSAGAAIITATWEDPNGTTHTQQHSVSVVTAVYKIELAQPDANSSVYTQATEYKEGTTYFTLTDGVYSEATGVTADNFASGTYYTMNVITAPMIIKDATEGQQYTGGIWAIVTEDGTDMGNLPDYDLEWFSSNEGVATINHRTGAIELNGVKGTTTITVAYDVLSKRDDNGNAIYDYAGTEVYMLMDSEGDYLLDDNGNPRFSTVLNDATTEVTIEDRTKLSKKYVVNTITDSITLSVSDEHWYVPEDGTDDFPEYPHEGSVRLDKTATAVGNFSDTGIVQVELSATGVPYVTGNEIDVVVMLDMTGSMSDNGMEAAEEATKAFVKMIVQKDDGTYNNNRVAVYAFNSGSSSPYELVKLGTIKSDEALAAANTAIDTASDKQASGGTPFDEAAEKCQSVLNEAKTTNLPEGISSADEYDRKQYCVFMSDGGPTAYRATYDNDNGYLDITNSGSGTTALTTYFTGYNSSDSSSWSYTLPTEYYTDQMKKDGVTIYTVGLLLQNKPSNPSPYSSMTASTYDSTTDSLTTIGSHYYFTSRVLKGMASSEDKYYDIFNVNNADKATAVFEAIGQAIREAASDVRVEDKITPEFTMIFELPNGNVEGLDNQEFYIEVKEYILTADYSVANGVTAENFAEEDRYILSDGSYVKAGSYTAGTTYYRISDYLRGSYTSLSKLYMGTSDGEYYAATDANGTAAAAPTFNQTPVGTMFYWTTNSAEATTYTDANGTEQYDATVTVDGTTYYFNREGVSNKSTGFDSTIWFNMASGAYAKGTVTTKDSEDASASAGVQDKTSTDLLIATPYYVYNAHSKILVWTTEKLSSTELALSYFLYLDKSIGWEEVSDKIDAGTYETNEYADLNYTNHLNTPCEQEFPVPQITWNGAQVSYVFYLVNAEGQPVNRAGRVVPFSEAVYVTDVFTYSVLWNDLEQAAALEAKYLATNLIPSVYELYDDDAMYQIHVYEDETEANLNNHFVISGDVTDTTAAHGNPNTTYVFNAKSDANKYTAYGTYIANDGTNSITTSTYWCKSAPIDGATFITEVTEGVTKYIVTSANYTSVAGETQVTEAAILAKNNSVGSGTVINGYVYYVDEDGQVYTIVEKTNGTEVHQGFDFSNTTVAFAVVWKPRLESDTVVIDYGLDVVIDVSANDNLSGSVVGVRKDAPAGVAENEGRYNAAKQNSTDVYLNGTNIKIGTASVESGTSVRFSLNDANAMQMNTYAIFYYESEVVYMQSDSSFVTTNMYSSVKVIPATTVYYEDEYVTLKTFTKNASGTYEETLGWDTNSVKATGIQDSDRPGEKTISEDWDHNNPYGYDTAYENMATYSMGMAAKTHVDTGKYATAEFDFYGTGFDVISVTSNKSGTITVKITDANTGASVKNLLVDTYYGYTFEWKWCQYKYTKAEDGTFSWVKTFLTENQPTTETSDAEITAMLEAPKENDTYYTYERIWEPASNTNDNALYQVPVIKAELGKYGKYHVVITATYNSYFDHTTDAGYDLYLDAIRIYDPANDGAQDDDTVIEDAYSKDNEGWPAYKELRNMIIAQKDFAETPTDNAINGIVFIDGIAAVDSDVIADYVSYGPNNEVYLASGQSIAFMLDLPDNVASAQIGIKSADGATVNCDIKLFNAGSTTYTTKSRTISTSTDMFYHINEGLAEDVKTLEGKVIVITNSGTDGVISLTNLKFTHTSEPVVEASEATNASSSYARRLNSSVDVSSYVYVVPTSIDQVLTVMNTPETEPEVNVPETTVPEETEPETTAPEETEPETTVPEESEPETTVPEETEPEVQEPETFTPASIRVWVNKDQVKKGENVMVTILTSTDVAALTVNGKVVENYVESSWLGIRTWIVVLRASEVGEMEISVVAYNDSGVAAEPVVETVTVKKDNKGKGPGKGKGNDKRHDALSIIFG